MPNSDPLNHCEKKSLWKMPRVDVGNTHKSCSKLVSEIQSQEIFHSMKDTNSFFFLRLFFNSVLIIDYIYTGINIIQRPTIPIATKIIASWTISKKVWFFFFAVSWSFVGLKQEALNILVVLGYSDKISKMFFKKAWVKL